MTEELEKALRALEQEYDLSHTVEWWDDDGNNTEHLYRFLSVAQRVACEYMRAKKTGATGD